ncbi:MAG: hypothetical protein AB7Y46_10380 [Armatimonadota bacterium]
MVRTLRSSRLLWLAPVSVALVLLGNLGQADMSAPLTSSHEGSFSVSYLQGQVNVGYRIAETSGAVEVVTLRLTVPARPRWLAIDGVEAAGGSLFYSPDDNQATVTVPPGEHTLEMGWETAHRPERITLRIPVDGPDAQLATLDGYFDASGFMEADGTLEMAEPVVASLRLEVSDDLDPNAVSVTTGSETIDRWWRVDRGLVSRQSTVLADGSRLSLMVREANLRASPVRRIALERVRTATVAVPVSAFCPPADAVLIEAEQVRASSADTDEGDIRVLDRGFHPDFGSSGESYVIDAGSHADTHGGACVSSFKGDGTTLWWTATVPEAGRYALYARVAQSWDGYRRLLVDARPHPGLDLVRFPSTGGWGHAAEEWQIVAIAGPPSEVPALHLSAGRHRIQMTGVLQNSINIDYLLLVPEPQLIGHTPDCRHALLSARH